MLPSLSRWLWWGIPNLTANVELALADRAFVQTERLSVQSVAVAPN